MSNGLFTVDLFSQIDSDDADQDEYVTDRPLRLGGLSYSAQIFTEAGEAISLEMLELLNRIAQRVEQDVAEIEALLLQHYQTCEQQGMTDPVPLGLTAEELNQHIAQRVIMVGDPMDVEPALEHRLFFDVAWDEEHGIYVELIEQSWQFSDVL